MIHSYRIDYGKENGFQVAKSITNLRPDLPEREKQIENLGLCA